MTSTTIEWGVSVERNQGPLTDEGMRFLYDDWSAPVIYPEDSKREALAVVRLYRESPDLFRNARLVKRSVTNWSTTR